jgi:hypothetical protein
VQLAGGTNLLDASRLSYLGEALRSLLVIEARAATLESSEPLEPPPPWVAGRGLGARRCGVRTTSGARVPVVLVGPGAVLGSEALRLYALRQTMVADAMATVVGARGRGGACMHAVGWAHA